MSGLNGGDLYGAHDLTDEQDARYQRQIDEIRAEEKAAAERAQQRASDDSTATPTPEGEPA
jgi:hypothetical protein